MTPSGSATGADHRAPGVRESELVATGLPIDHDDDPDTPDVVDPEHPYAAAENGLRDELGLPIRESYER